MTKEDIRKQLYHLIGKEVMVYIDRPVNSVHPRHIEMIYKVNYGYIKEIIALDNAYQDAYLLGIDYPVDQYQGTVYAVVEREDDIEYKLIVVANNDQYTIEELEEKIFFQEQYFKYKIFK